MRQEESLAGGPTPRAHANENTRGKPATTNLAPERGEGHTKQRRHLRGVEQSFRLEDFGQFRGFAHEKS
jgi:hypothetical protein